MVFITESDDDLLVFPPINHENLYTDGFEMEREPSSTPSSSSSFDSDGRYEFNRKPQCHPLETDGKSPPSRWTTFLSYYSELEASIIQRWWKLLLARVLPRFRTMVSCLCSFSETLRSFYPVIVVVIWWWMRNRARRRGETEAHLRESIKERDEVVAKLLHQIAQMNELLIEKKHSN
ncbi:hypothetical protein IGI04_012536 [Brassica rapa subsp. trilocularis]|uniref:Transmembrane protein n=1 Tax=Brassica rapa subsp. trilocularis TaxID=1813537 RepID=A0ABQ7N695_BRACM|nr:hypothetical protein IGI04_012536 [Brassica rapa subsp. trilocularis]